MIIAQGVNENQNGEVVGKILLIGLTRPNIERLMRDEAIQIRRETHGPAMPEGLSIIIGFGETEQDLVRELAKAGLIGLNTVFHEDDRMRDN